MLFGPGIDAQGAEEFVCRDKVLPEDFSEPAAANPAQQFHLKETILGMHVAQGEVGIFLTLRVDMRHTVLVVVDFHLAFQALKGDGALVDGLGGLNI